MSHEQCGFSFRPSEFDNNIQKCSEWLEKSSIESCDSSIISTEQAENDAEFGDYLLCERFGCDDENEVATNLANILNNKTSHNIQNLRIYKSRNVHVGDKVYVSGPLFINQRQISHTQYNINLPFLKIPEANAFPIVSRRAWVAEPPRGVTEYLKEPAKFVIILHSATEEPKTQAEAIESIRHIQSFHIASKKMDDIAYNFIISNEGVVYEGRGWCVEGGNAKGYNAKAVGICFLGCYISKAPMDLALRKAQGLIKYGVEIGAIKEDYVLLGHCQCSGTESPGEALFAKIKTWENWDGSVSVENPSPIIFEDSI